MASLTALKPKQPAMQPVQSGAEIPAIVGLSSTSYMGLTTGTGSAVSQKD